MRKGLKGLSCKSTVLLFLIRPTTGKNRVPRGIRHPGCTKSILNHLLLFYLFKYYHKILLLQMDYKYMGPDISSVVVQLDKLFGINRLIVFFLCQNGGISCSAECSLELIYYLRDKLCIFDIRINQS